MNKTKIRATEQPIAVDIEMKKECGPSGIVGRSVFCKKGRPEERAAPARKKLQKSSKKEGLFLRFI